MNSAVLSLFPQISCLSPQVALVQDALDKPNARRQSFAMSDDILAPQECSTMTEVRAGVDALDRELVALLDRRFAYMRAAARIKPERAAVRDEGRKAEVIAGAVTEAERRALPAEVVAAMWEVLVEGSIAYELARWDQTRV